MKYIILLLLSGLSFSVPACPSYPYHDYVEARSYQPPQKPVDSILQYCSFNIDPVCILTDILNTTEDKKLFIAESIANDSFGNIQAWNDNIPFGKYPPNSSESSTTIKDAWVNIAYFTPSVYDNGTYLLNTSSKAAIKSNFTFVVDTSQLPGDCYDNFRICGYDYSISNQSSLKDFNAILNVKSEYMIDRSHLVTHCDKSGCWVTCDYYMTDDHKDSLSVSNSKSILYENFTINSNYSINTFNGLAEILINANDSNVHFEIGNSSFDKTGYRYTIYDEGPYNVVAKQRVYENVTSVYGASILDNNGSEFLILAPNSDDCSLTVYEDFDSSSTSGCAAVQTNSSFQEVPAIQPKFFASLPYLAVLGIALYLTYLFAKRVIT